MDYNKRLRLKFRYFLLFMLYLNVFADDDPTYAALEVPENDYISPNNYFQNRTPGIIITSLSAHKIQGYRE